MRCSIVTAIVCLGAVFTGSTVGCATGSDEAVTRPSGEGAPSTDGPSGAGGGGLGGSQSVLFVDAGAGGDGAVEPIAQLSISPRDPVFDVAIADGKVVSIAPSDVALEASVDGKAVSADWSIDRGELGTLGLATGTFAPNGVRSGVATVTASRSGATATTTITVRVHAVSNGAPPGYVADGGGVGGEGLGGPVDEATVAGLRGAKSPPVVATELGWLYPYDKTVWPRRILAPLVQWQTSLGVTAVYLHVTQKNFEFEGFYSGTKLVHQPIDQEAWDTALNGNAGDMLHVELSVAVGGNVTGPIAQDWMVASGPLRGAVYYNAYHTQYADIAPNEKVAAGVLVIKPGATVPELALAGARSHCIACHTVSDDGSTFFAQVYRETGTDTADYRDGASYDLRSNGALIASYVGGQDAPDRTTNDEKFLWSALSKDGTYALVSASAHDRHATEQSFRGPVGLYRRDNGNAMPSSGLEGITTLVTPAFSRDGKKVAFNYWDGTAGPGGGNGQTIDLMDFACTSAGSGAAGAPSCGSGTFSNLRRLYASPTDIVGWPAWLPDSSGIVFHDALASAPAGGPLATWFTARAQIWYASVPADSSTAVTVTPLCALNGTDEQGNSMLPKVPGRSAHDEDYKMNYEPTVNPIVSGGYNWVVFTSRRAYGNVLTNDPFEPEDSAGPSGFTKKLWVAALDLKPTAGKDPSHPAFYLPGQELMGANMRGFWAVEPCRDDGQSCEAGDECCGGFCRPSGEGGALVCGQKPTGCVQAYERCEVTSDCCGASDGYECINAFCAEPQPAVVR